NMVLKLCLSSGKSTQRPPDDLNLYFTYIDSLDLHPGEETSESTMDIKFLFPMNDSTTSIAKIKRESQRRSRRRSSARTFPVFQIDPSHDSLATVINEMALTNSLGSTSTVAGLGVLIGRVIKAIGSIAVTGIDKILIKRRMSIYRSMFPHGRNVERTGDNGNEMYSEILEFT
ncbi:hypothetical protein H0H93_001047, partial [Arthromyces matolae]